MCRKIRIMKFINQLKEKKKVEGRQSFLTHVQDGDRSEIDYLDIYQVITHGKFASIHGVIAFVNDEKIDFCDVYTFSSAAKTGKVKEITSYRIADKREDA